MKDATLRPLSPVQQTLSTGPMKVLSEGWERDRAEGLRNEIERLPTFQTHLTDNYHKGKQTKSFNWYC
jgi:hypothetical protein